ncbi:MAG: LysM peptidoglycan-binding domain-containing protein [Chloroflexi bacterium]|nr:LysM peptidoglycan-binding domain-containing protein [Chloroflexota bacterium]
MKLRLGLILALWGVLTLACSLTEGDSNQSPTLRPAIPTADLTIVAQANATASAIVSAQLTPTATATTNSGNSNTGNNTNPNCTPRTDWPVMVVSSGDTLSGIAERTGSTVETLVQANCLLNADAIFAGQQLRVPLVPIQPTAYIPAGCGVSFFFTFAAGKGDASGLCPLATDLVAATGQDFEGGRVYRYAAPAGASDPRATIWVIYNTGYWETVPDIWDASQPFSDATIIPPTGRYQPTGPIGKVWRENPQIRQQLGWAYAPEQAFPGRLQAMPASAPPPHYFYIDHGKGIVLRLYSVDMAPNTWEVVGSY